MLTFIFALIAITGYLIISLSNNLQEALIGNRIAYLGNVFLLTLLLMTIANICKVKILKPIVVLLFSIAVVMLLFSLSQGYLDLFYKDVKFEIVDGFARLTKAYGPMHTLYMVYIYFNVVIILSVVIYSIIKKKSKNKVCLGLICTLCVLNVLMWLIEKIINNQVEYLALCYFVSVILLLIIYKKLEKAGAFDPYRITFTLNEEHEQEVKISQQISITVDNDSFESISIPGENNELLLLNEEELKKKLDKTFDQKNLTNREKEIVYLILKGYKRKQISEVLYISQDTVKTHTTHIFQKLNVSSQTEVKNQAADILRNN